MADGVATPRQVRISRLIEPDMQRSMRAFRELLLPTVAATLGIVHAAPCEGSRDEACRMLDLGSGIDWIGERPDGTVVGLAVRCQPSDKCWRTFSVRTHRHTGNETELAKIFSRRKRSAPGLAGTLGIRPQIVLQCYYSTRPPRMLGAAAVEEAALHALLRQVVEMGAHRDAQGRGWGVRSNPDDGNEFLWLGWDWMRSLRWTGIEIMGDG